MRQVRSWFNNARAARRVRAVGLPQPVDGRRARAYGSLQLDESAGNHGHWSPYHHELLEDDWIRIQSHNTGTWFLTAIRAAHGALAYEDEVTPTFRTPPSFSVRSAFAIPGFKDEVIPTFRTPPPFFVCPVPACRKHEDKVIPTFRGHPTDRPSVPMCFRTRHKLCVHRCGIG